MTTWMFPLLGVSLVTQASCGSLICWTTAACTRSGWLAFSMRLCRVSLHSGSLQVEAEGADEPG